MPRPLRNAISHGLTGNDWLNCVDLKYPRGFRHFLVVVSTGYPERIPTADRAADFVLEKPWRRDELFGFLAEMGFVSIY